MRSKDSSKNKKTSLFWRHFCTWLILIVFLLQISSFFFVTYFPKSAFFAEISKSLLLSLTNQERKSLGVGSLREDSKLNQAAYLKAKDMIANDYFAHTSPAGLTPWYWFKKVGYNYQYAGENLAIDFIDSEELFQAWDNSPSHRENIVNANYTNIGMAVVSGEFEGGQTTIVVQVFGSPAKALAKEPAPAPTLRTQPSTQVTRPSTAVVSSGPTLYGYFAEKGKSLPSFEQRSLLYEKYELGPSSVYKGTAEQNIALLNALVKGEKTEKLAVKPTPPEPTSPQPETPEPTVAQKPEKEILPSKVSPEEKGISYKVLNLMAKHYDAVTKNAFLIVLALIIISLSFDFFGGTGVHYGGLFLKGTFYTFVILVLYSLDKEVILQFLPRALKIL